MKKYIIGVILIVVAIILLLDYNTTKDLKFGKDLHIEISTNEIRDYTILETEKFRFWNDKEAKQELIEYMKKNNLKIKPKEYVIRQGATYKQALEIFEFEDK